MNLIQSIVDRAKANKQRIVLPEGTEERTLVAAESMGLGTVYLGSILADPRSVVQALKLPELTSRS